MIYKFNIFCSCMVNNISLKSVKDCPNLFKPSIRFFFFFGRYRKCGKFAEYLLIRQPRRRSDFPYSKYRQRRMRRQSTGRFTSFTNMATEDLRVSQISIRGEFVRMKRVNCEKLYFARTRYRKREKKIFIKLNT